MALLDFLEEDAGPSIPTSRCVSLPEAAKDDQTSSARLDDVERGCRPRMQLGGEAA
jgi:hypothetical protein